MVRFSEIQQFPDFLETFPGNSVPFVPVWKISKFLVEWPESAPRRRRQRERHQTKRLMSRTMAIHVSFESWYIS